VPPVLGAPPVDVPPIDAPVGGLVAPIDVPPVLDAPIDVPVGAPRMRCINNLFGPLLCSSTLAV